MKVAGWSAFQHYLKRRPPWIKLHRTLLDNPEFMRLPTASKALAPLVWLLASESANAGELPPISDISWRLRMQESEVIAALIPLVSGGFIEDASNTLAACVQDALPERERETETEGEREPPISPTRTATDERTATDSLKANGPTDAEIDAIREEHAIEESRLTGNLVALRDSSEDLQTVLDSIAEKGRKPYSAYGWLRNGRSGVPQTAAGVTVLRLLNGALEARQRAQAAPYVSDKNRISFDSIDRVLGTGAFSEARKPITGGVK